MRLAREEKKGRYVALITIFVSVFMVFLLTLVRVQFVDAEKYNGAGTSSFASTQVKATRGQILDRNGKVLVGNRQGNDLVFNASKFPPTPNRTSATK